MDITVTFPGTMFGDITVEVTPTTKVSELVEMMEREWALAPDLLQLTFRDKVLTSHSDLLSTYGIASNDELVAQLKEKTYFTKEDLKQQTTIEDVNKFYARFPDKFMFLDSSVFCSGGSLRARAIPNCVNHLGFYNVRAVTQLPTSFLFNSSLQSIDLSAFCNATRIGSYFLSNCRVLTSVDLSGLTKVTQVKDYFLQTCTSLKSINLSGLCNVERIGTGFLQDCSQLSCIDLTSFSNLMFIGESFLLGCTGLTSLDMESLPNVIHVGKSFNSHDACIRDTVVDAARELAAARRERCHQSFKTLMSSTAQ
eukprot:TRINITY_DN4715_c0_g1_i1.p1 TRINITY_DN4715_c0_g1~~TRINITY_DN4715_c0_g1_i1.p1  ORF type:complete len:333 (+),score=39.74 TRINITY_DN4715_c0_g1_i1:70-999(+)